MLPVIAFWDRQWNMASGQGGRYADDTSAVASCAYLVRLCAVRYAQVASVRSVSLPLLQKHNISLHVHMLATCAAARLLSAESCASC